MELLEIVNNKLKEHFHGDIESAELLYDFPVFTIRKDIIHDVIKFLKEDEELAFGFLTTMCGMHYPDNAETVRCNVSITQHAKKLPYSFKNIFCYF
jgi:NADH-quinone oxidoreductase subunit C